MSAQTSQTPFIDHDEPASTRVRLLNAAEAVVRASGAVKLTLDAVAKAAHVSKGGLLYHFPSKESLVRCLIERVCDEFDMRLAHFRSLDPNPVGRTTRAYIRATLEMCSNGGNSTCRLDSALIAAMASDQSLVEPLRLRYRKWRAAVADDGLAPPDAMIIQLAMDGLWYSAVLSLEPPSERMVHEIATRLEDFASQTRQAA